MVRRELRLASDMLRHPLQRVRRTLRDARVRGDVLYPNLATLVERHGGSSIGLTGAELKVFSQNGEDGVIAEVLRRVGTRARTFVEFGIGAGIEGNCVFLADVLGWAGTFIEGSESLHGLLASKYAANDAVQALHHSVTAENINGILNLGRSQPVVDVLSIDIDGNDYWVWKAIEAIDARLVVIEYNGSIDPRKALVQPYRPHSNWDSTGSFGASLSALVQLGQEKGYTLIHSELTGTNSFFVKDELAHAFADLGPSVLRAANYNLDGSTHLGGAAASSYLAIGGECSDATS
ncbi:MAG: hypothetical protein WKF86_02340 [Acidimicrobiales bacterium]